MKNRSKTFLNKIKTLETSFLVFFFAFFRLCFSCLLFYNQNSLPSRSRSLIGIFAPQTRRREQILKKKKQRERGGGGSFSLFSFASLGCRPCFYSLSLFLSSPPSSRNPSLSIFSLSSLSRRRRQLPGEVVHLSAAPLELLAHNLHPLLRVQRRGGGGLGGRGRAFAAVVASAVGDGGLFRFFF